MQDLLYPESQRFHRVLFLNVFFLRTHQDQVAFQFRATDDSVSEFLHDIILLHCYVFVWEALATQPSQRIYVLHAVLVTSMVACAELLLYVDLASFRSEPAR